MSSGLLPRTIPTSSQGSYDSLTTSTLTVNNSALIASANITDLTADNFSISSLTIGSVSGNPNLSVTAPSCTLNGSEILSTTNNQVVSNKTINSASNTITITNSPLVATNINSLINQDVRTTAQPLFLSLSTTGDINCHNSVICDNDVTGLNGLVSLTTVKSPVYETRLTGESLSLRTAGVNRIVIPSTGISLDNTQTNILALNGTTLVYKNNVIDTNTSQVLSNKTIDSASNTITITNSPLVATNINSLINQDVRTTSSPSYVGMTINSPGSIGITVNSTGGQPQISLESPTGNAYQNFNAASATRLQVGALSSISKSIVWSTGAYPLSLGVAGNEVLQIPTSGISLDNTQTNILALNGTTLVYKNNILDTSSNQSITGVKTFSTAPVISSITNVGTLTLPTTTGTLALTSDIPTNSTYVDLTTAQSISGVKTFTNAPNISSITNASGTYFIGAPGGGTLATTAQVIASLANYVDLTSAQSISGVKTFSTAPVISSITNTGTLTLPTATTTIVGRNTNDTLTTKTMDSASNTLTITSGSLVATNINSVVNQPLLSTSNVTFNSVTCTGALSAASIFNQIYLGYQTGSFGVYGLYAGGSNNLCYNMQPIKGSITGIGSATIVNCNLPTSGSSATVSIQLTCNSLNGAIRGYSQFRYDWKVVNNGGTLVFSNGSDQITNQQALAGAWNGKVTFTTSSLTTNFLVSINTAGFTTEIINYGGYSSYIYYQA